MVWFLQRLGNCIQFPLVATTVVCLRFAGHRADEVAVYPHGEAEHIDHLLNIQSPVASLLLHINFVDAYIVLLLSVRRYIECREKCFASVLGTSEEINNASLLFHDTLLHPFRVSDAFPLEDVLPILCAHLDMVLDGRSILQFRLLSYVDKRLDVIPFTFEQRDVVWNRIIGGGQASARD